MADASVGRQGSSVCAGRTGNYVMIDGNKRSEVWVSFRKVPCGDQALFLNKTFLGLAPKIVALHLARDREHSTTVCLRNNSFNCRRMIRVTEHPSCLCATPIRKPLEHDTVSNNSHFLKCTLWRDAPSMRYELWQIDMSINFIQHEASLEGKER